jgi:excisionase family DNA binding protein
MKDENRTRADWERRLSGGAPLRLGELAKLLGFSREHVRKLADAGVVKAIRAERPGAHRRVDVEEAARFAHAEGVL